MELKEYLAIMRKRANLFLGVILAALVCGALFYFFQPVRYRAELVLNVTRRGVEKTPDYQFDDFYRLQADERFADTIVRWLETPRMQDDIRKAAGIGNIAFSLTSKRLSSQMITVEVVTNNPQLAQEIAQAAPGVVNQESDKLNQWQKKENWFRVVSDAPVVASANWAWYRIILIALALGIFAGFWAVLLRHYFN